MGEVVLHPVLVERFAIGRGIELPLLHSISASMTRVELHTVRYTPCGVTYDVYYTADGVLADVNLSLARENPFGPTWKGDIVVLRRCAPGGFQYENVDEADKDLALRAVVL